MSLYGNTVDMKELNEFRDYIRNDFLNYCLDEEVIDIRHDIEVYRETGIGQLDILKKLAKLTDKKNKRLDDIAKKQVMEAYTEAYNYRNVYNESMSLEVPEKLLEYAGNDYKNDQFKKTLQEIEKHLIAYVKEIEIIDKTLTKFTNSLNKSKNVNSARKAYSDCVKEGKATVKAINTMYESLNNGIDPFTKFKSQAGSFNNKYSTVTMEEKKIFDNKIKAYIKQIEDHIEPWAAGPDGKNNAKIQGLCDALDKFQEHMPELHDKATELAMGWYNYYFKAYQEDMAMCNYIRRKLGIEIEGTLRWKIVHALFK